MAKKPEKTWGIPRSGPSSNGARVNIPTQELRGFVASEDAALPKMLYPRDPSGRCTSLRILVGGVTAVIDNRSASGACFDASRVYRYRLWRDWHAPPQPSRRVLWIMLNPSTADDVTLDPTIRRCIAFSRAWGYTGLEVVNLFALRATDPALLRRAADPVGAGNDAAIAAALGDCHAAVAGWGAHPLAVPRAALVRDLARALRRPLFCLGVTKSGQPRHPLYLRAATRRQRVAVP
jgi:hypothetical protein